MRDNKGQAKATMEEILAFIRRIISEDEPLDCEGEPAAEETATDTEAKPELERRANAGLSPPVSSMWP